MSAQHSIASLFYNEITSQATQINSTYQLPHKSCFNPRSNINPLQSPQLLHYQLYTKKLLPTTPFIHLH